MWKVIEIFYDAIVLVLVSKNINFETFAIWTGDKIVGFKYSA